MRKLKAQWCKNILECYCLPRMTVECPWQGRIGNWQQCNIMRVASIYLCDALTWRFLTVNMQPVSGKTVFLCRLINTMGAFSVKNSRLNPRSIKLFFAVAVVSFMTDPQIIMRILFKRSMYFMNCLTANNFSKDERRIWDPKEWKLVHANQNFPRYCKFER